MDIFKNNLLPGSAQVLFAQPVTGFRMKDGICVLWGRVLFIPEILRLPLAEEEWAVRGAFQGKSGAVLLPSGANGRLKPA